MAMVGNATHNTSSPQADDKQIIGSTAFVQIANHYDQIPAKIDTGADSSSIWASNINVDSNGQLTFCLFAPSSPFYDGFTLAYPKGEYSAVAVRPSTGEQNIRYRVKIPISINGRKLKASFTLADRQNNSLPILIGRRALLGRFLVDVSINPINRKMFRNEHSKKLTHMLRQDPKKFHQTYIKENLKGDQS